jgi:Icc-related predicted phosphoesterase
MRIVCIADSHRTMKMYNVIIPPADVLLYAGDDDWSFSSHVKDFNKWLKTIPMKHKIVIAGNHDWYAQEANTKVEKYLTEAKYLRSSGCEVMGIKFWGSPYTPIFCDWAFNLYHEELKVEWGKIPEDTQVLITHGPPYGILDQVLPREESVGDRALLDKITKLPNLKLHVFGHIHCAYGIEKKGEVTFINASLCNEAYAPVNKPVEIEI